MIYLLCGPPCAGKTTLARKLAKPEDEILDFDLICTELDGQPGWSHSKPVRERAGRLLEQRIRQPHQPRDGDTYLIRTAPTPAERTHLARTLKAQVWLLNPGQLECMRRARVDGRPARTTQAIVNWYATYRPAKVDGRPPEVVTTRGPQLGSEIGSNSHVTQQLEGTASPDPAS